MSEFFCARLLNGEHIIGKLEGRDNDTVYLSKALLLSFQRGENGQTGMAFMPVSPLVDLEQDGNTVNIYKTSIVMEVEFNKQIIDAYKQTVGEIIIAPATILTAR